MGARRFNKQTKPSARTVLQANWRQCQLHTQDFGAWHLKACGWVDKPAGKTYVDLVIVNESNARYYETAPGRQWMTGVNPSWQF